MSRGKGGGQKGSRIRAPADITRFEGFHEKRARNRSPRGRERQRRGRQATRAGYRVPVFFFIPYKDAHAWKGCQRVFLLGISA